VAFILALGKWTESPFRAMDEYDVFMDAVNRRIATQTLLEFALEEDGLQFVLLTPQVRRFVIVQDSYGGGDTTQASGALQYVSPLGNLGLRDQPQSLPSLRIAM
jgi:hypothetical protein